MRAMRSPTAPRAALPTSPFSLRLQEGRRVAPGGESTEKGVGVAPLQPSNCGFDVRVGERLGWSPHLRQHFAGQVLKNVG